MIIYKTTNKINGKIYIGQHTGKKKYYIGSGIIITKAIKKYGKENFEFKILAKGDFDNEYTNYLEKYFIKLYNSTNPEIGYNIHSGGGYSGDSYKRMVEIRNKKKLENFIKRRNWAEKMLLEKYNLKD